jgi:autotransporter-associated beta strand protein
MPDLNFQRSLLLNLMGIAGLCIYTSSAWGACNGDTSISTALNVAQSPNTWLCNYTITNSGSISTTGNFAAALAPSANIDNLSNAGTIAASGASSHGIANTTAGVIVSNLANTGTISITGTGSGISNTRTITSINNSSQISSVRDAIVNTTSATISSIENTGTISSSTGNGIYNFRSTIGVITNTGSIVGSVARTGIFNVSGSTIGTLNNLQGAGNVNGALVYRGVMPTNYNIIITSASNYGRLTGASNLTTTTGQTTTFGIYSGSTISAGTYTEVLSNLLSDRIANYGSIFNTWNNFNSSFRWQLVQGGSATTWNLAVEAIPVVQVAPAVVEYVRPPNIVAGSTGLLSSVGAGFSPVLDGGILKVDAASTTRTAFTIGSAGGKIDANGLKAKFSGVFSDDGVGAGQKNAGRLTIVNTAAVSATNLGQAVVVLDAVNTHTGGIEVQAGAALSIASSSALGSGTLDLVGSLTVPAILITTETMTINNPITVSGDPTFDVALGTTTTITSGMTDGVSSGDVVVSGGGKLNLTAVNTYTGPTAIDAGSTLALSDVGSIATSSTLSNSGTFDISATTSGATIKALTGSGVVALGAQNLAISNAGGNFSGSVWGTGGLNIIGGSQTLSGTHAYTGSTNISSGATLVLSDAASIATSRLVANNGTLNIAAKTTNVSVANYTQTSTGNLAMNFSPISNQQLLVAGTASLAGDLTLTASAGAYRTGRYALLSAGSVTGSFGILNSNLSSLTSLGYQLGYDSSNVYLVFTPNVADTQQSLVNTASALQNTYTLQNSVLANSFSYDCTEFGVNNICISAGGRNTAVSAANGLNNSSGLLIAAYRPHPNYRVGVYADQNLSVSNPGGAVNLGNNTPLLGLFGAWNERLDGTGTEIKVSASYGQKNATVTRPVVGTAESGAGASQLNSQGAQVTAKYGFAVMPAVIVSPYVGIRYTQNNMDGYTEATSVTVSAPLAYSALNTNATTALAGLGVFYRLTPVVTTFASAGVETDTNTSNGTYSATGIAGLKPINFNVYPVKTRPTATLGAYYDVTKNQRLGMTGIYRQEPYQAVSTTTVMATYTVGL